MFKISKIKLNLSSVKQNPKSFCCDSTYMFLMQQEVLRVIDVIVVRILHPDPERLRRGTVVTVLPAEIGLDGESYPEYGASDRLDDGIQLDDRDVAGTFLDDLAHADVLHHVACRGTAWRKMIRLHLFNNTHPSGHTVKSLI